MNTYDGLSSAVLGILAIISIVLFGVLAYAGYRDYTTETVCVSRHEEIASSCLESNYRGVCVLWGQPKPTMVCDKWETRKK